MAILTMLIYFGTLQNAFINLDDNLYIYENNHIRTLDFQLVTWAFTSFHAGNWHPLTWLSHAVDYSLWGLNPMGHHLTSIVLHSLNTFLVILLCSRLIQLVNSVHTNNKNEMLFSEKGSILASIAAGLMFGINPLHVESVAWASERKDVLCALFYLMSLLFYIRHSKASLVTFQAGQSTCAMYSHNYGISFLCFFLALLSKPMAVSLPIILLLLDWYPLARFYNVKPRVVFIEKIPFLLLGFASSLITIKAQQSGGAVGLLTDYPLAKRISVALYSSIAYVGKLVAPLNLSPFYPYPTWQPFSIEAIGSLLLFIAISLFCIMQNKRQKIWLVVWMYYLVTILPVIGIVQVGDQGMADRYMYLPSIGWCILFGIGTVSANTTLQKLGQHKHEWIGRSILILLSVSYMVFLSYTTIKQIKIWRNDKVFWNYIIAVEPQAALAYNNLGNVMFKAGELREAIALFEKTITLSMSSAVPQAYNNLAVCYLETKQFEKAAAHAMTALKHDPKNGAFHNTMGEVSLANNDYRNALASFRASISLNPEKPNGYFNAALAAEKLGNIDAACDYFKSYLSFTMETGDIDEVGMKLKDLGCH